MAANAKIAGHFCATDSGRDVAGMLLTPVFTYRPGTLFLEEHAILKTLNSSHMSVDLPMQLIFDPKSKTVP